MRKKWWMDTKGTKREEDVRNLPMRARPNGQCIFGVGKENFHQQLYHDFPVGGSLTLVHLPIQKVAPTATGCSSNGHHRGGEGAFLWGMAG